MRTSLNEGESSKASLSKVELVNHAVRLRILEAIGIGQRTPKEIAAKLSDVPQATLYRHLSLLLDGGLIEVVATRQAHGVIESTYARKKDAAHFTRQEFAAISPEDHKGLHAMLAGSAGIALGRYVGQDSYDTTREGMTYFGTTLKLTDEQAQQLRLDFIDLMRRYGESATPEGGPRLITVSLIPEISNELN